MYLYQVINHHLVHWYMDKPAITAFIWMEPQVWKYTTIWKKAVSLLTLQFFFQKQPSTATNVKNLFVLQNCRFKKNSKSCVEKSITFATLYKTAFSPLSSTQTRLKSPWQLSHWFQLLDLWPHTNSNQPYEYSLPRLRIVQFSNKSCQGLWTRKHSWALASEDAKIVMQFENFWIYRNITAKYLKEISFITGGRHSVHIRLIIPLPKPVTGMQKYLIHVISISANRNYQFHIRYLPMASYWTTHLYI